METVRLRRFVHCWQ